MKVKKTKRVFVDENSKKTQKCNEHDTSLLNAVKLLWNKTFMIMQLCTYNIHK